MKRRKLEPIIIETSLQMFIDKGYDKVSVVDICNACDITKPTFYKYATSKGDLLRFFFNRIPANFDDDWYNIEKYGSYWECIQKVLLSFLQNFMNYGLDLCTQLYIQNIESYQDTFTVTDEFREKFIEIIARAQENGELDNLDDPKELADSCLSMMIGFGGYWVLYNGTRNAQEEFIQSLGCLLQPKVLKPEVSA